MNIHDGIPFVKLEFASGTRCYINPVDISSVHDMSEESSKKQKVKHPAVLIIYRNGKEQHVGNLTAKDFVEQINKTMIGYKDKLADKALME